MEWQPIETAPKDGTLIVVWARWDWGDMYKDECDEPYAAQVAGWEDGASWNRTIGECVGAFISVSFNPYRDFAVHPTHWMPLPEPPS